MIVEAEVVDRSGDDHLLRTMSGLIWVCFEDAGYRIGQHLRCSCDQGHMKVIEVL